MSSPFVYWAQNEASVFLRVDLKNVTSHDIAIEEEEISCTAIGVGAHGDHRRYHFVIEFFLPVCVEGSTYEVKGREISISIKKKESDWWPRLLYQQQKLSWLKIDFDRWKNEDDSNDSEEDRRGNLKGVTSEDMIKTQFPEVYKRLQKDELGYISESRRKIYLFCYNLSMVCGFAYAATLMAIRFAKHKEEFIPEAYRTVGNVFKMLHLIMFLEVLHPIFGYTKGSVYQALMQIAGRNFVIFFLIEAEPRMQEKPVVCYLFLLYCTIELFRYPYYMLRVYDVEVGLLTWLRYTIWIPLYPAGFFCEGVIMLRNIPYFEETERFSLLLPNSLNFAFYFPSLIRFYLLFLFFPLLYTMMNHMYHLRCKKLGIRQHERNRKKKDD